MNLFDVVPGKFFTILTSSKKALYLEALFVIRDAFKSTELVISRDELIAMLKDQLEDRFNEADFSEEAEEEENNVNDTSGKVHLLLRRIICIRHLPAHIRTLRNW